MANNSPTIVAASLSDDQLKKSIDSLVTHVDEAMKKMVQSTNNAVGEMEAKLKSLGNLKIDYGGTADGGSSKRTKKQQEETQAVKETASAHKEIVTTLDQEASIINTVIQSEKKYTDEIRKQADAIRESQQWKEKGFVTIGNAGFYNPDTSKLPKKERLSLEEQILQYQNRQIEAAAQQEKVQQSVTQAVAGTAKMEENVNLAQRRQNEWAAQKGLGKTTSENVAYLRTQIADLLGVQEKEVNMVNVEKASYDELSNYIKQLQSAYRKFGGDIAGRQGKDIADELQRAQREAQKFQQQMSRPTSLKAAMGLDEKTLDDIAYKMRQLASYRSGLNVETQSKEITQVNDEYNRLKKRMDEVMQKNQQMIASNTALGRSWNYMKNRLAFYFTVGASTQFVKNLIEVRSQYEMNERALGILINSAERGTQIFNELSQMALVSPYTLIELSSAAKQLTAYDVAAKDVVDTTRRLADMAAAVGIPIERLTYALGQIKAYGYLNSRDNRMFANAGIPLVKQLADYYTELEGRLVSTADVYDRIKKKSVGYEEVMSVIAKMTDEGGKFYDFQAKMAETLKVQLANLTLAWNNMLNAMGEETQGVLVGSINALKQMFLHWKDIEHVLTEVVVALGAYKAYQIITTRLMGATAASLDAQVLAMKRNKAAMLEKQALTRKLTIDELRQVAAQNQVTAADYRNALSGKQLTKQKAMLLVALNMNNVQLKAAIVNMGLLTAEEVANMTIGKALTVVFKSIGISIRNAALAMKAFMVSNWWMIALAGLYELYHAWDEYDEHVKEINRSAAEHAKEAFKNIKQYLESDVISQIRDKVATPQGISETDGQKAWDEMREKIELSSKASNAFIAKLLDIENINDRIKAGFGYLEDVERVAGVMQTLEKDAISVSTTTWGGVLGEGLKDDLNDFLKTKDEVIAAFGDIGKAEQELKKQQETADVGIGSVLYNMQEFEKEVKKTTDSIFKISTKEGFNPSEQREFFEREISEIVQAEQMGAREARIFRIKAEEEYNNTSIEMYKRRLEILKKAGETAMYKEVEAEKKAFEEQFSTQKSLQESFFSWVSEKHANEVRKRFGNMTKEEIEHIDWSQKKWGQWAKKLAEDFSNEYGVSFDGLHKLVLQANTWKINIPVFFQTLGNPLSEVQSDYEARTGKKFKDNPLIKDAKSQVEILDILKKKQKEVAGEMETARKAGGKYWEDNKNRFKEENDALVSDIHAYNALTDAEEKANKKGGKGSKKDQLLDALKQEISLVEKLQGDYDKLSKSGASQSDALKTIRGAYGKTVRLLNTQLQSYGLPQIDISQLITGKDPNKALAHFKQTLDTLVNKGLLTLERSKELEVVVEKFTLSAKTYNLDKITKGLNNELGKLKDEYELAVELDANPELGSMFADMFGINTSTLPKTFGDALDRAQTIINRKLAEMNITTPFDLMQSNIDDFAKSAGLDRDSAVIKELIAAQNSYRDMFKKNITETEKVLDDYIKKYGDYSDKIAEIEASRLEKLKKLNEAYYTEEMRKRPEYIAKLNAIEQGAKKEEQQVDFDEFKNSRYYTMMFENLDYISTKTIRDMRDYVRELIDTMNDLTPEQLKQIMTQYEKLEQKLVKRSPFKTLTKDLKNYLKTSGDRKAANEAFRNAQKEYDAQEKNVAALKEKYEQAKANTNTSQSYLDFLQIEINGENEILKILKEQLDAAEKKADKYNLIKKLALEEAAATAQLIAQNLASLAELRDNLQQTFGFDFGDNINAAIDGLTRAGDGLSKAISSLQSGNVVGAASGVVDIIGGIGDSIASIFGDGSARTKRLNKEINKSKETVRQLGMAYDDLERAVEKSLGTAETEAKRAAIANKELQLAELERQKTLEESKRSKDRDDDAIKQYEEDIHSLRNEINDLKEEVVNNLWGDDVKSAAEAFIDTWVSAWKAGKTTLKDIKDEMNDIMLNIVKKGVSSKIVEGYLSPIYKELDRMTKSDSKGGVALTNDELKAISDMSKTAAVDINNALKALYGQLDLLGVVKPDNNLSALQQGIQGVTEDTAGAIEAYMNGVSQQVYLQSDLLTQIRDAVVGLDIDVQTATMGEILLQLRSSYEVQMAIHGILEGVLTPSGQGFRVELLS